MNQQEFLQSLRPSVRSALQHSAEWRLISTLLERPREGWAQDLINLALEASDPALQHAAQIASSGCEEEYLLLFGPGAPVSPREVAYAGYEDPGRMFADIQAFYTAFSFMPRAEDPADHIAVESGFVGYLYLKEAYALLAENEDAVSITQTARERFLVEHLARLARGMAAKISGNGPSYFQETLTAMEQRMAHIPAAPIPELPPEPDCPENIPCGLS